METFNIVEALNKHVNSCIQVIRGYPHYSKIEEQIRVAQKKIDYEFHNIYFLMLAFCRTKISIPKSSKNYMNDTLAQLGDAILDAVISERYFAEGKNKSDIDDMRQILGKNKNLFSITTQKSLITFCYHEQSFCDEAPMEYQVATGSHDSIVEAIIGAIYLDRGLDKARQWIYKNIICDITKEN